LHFPADSRNLIRQKLARTDVCAFACRLAGGFAMPKSTLCPVVRLIPKSARKPKSPLDELLGVLFDFGEGELGELRRRLNECLDQLGAGG
jgi:hypothetical protein